MQLSLFSALFAVSVAIAAPTKTCDASKATLTLPASQPSGTPLATPVGNPKFIGLAVGVQNYTCAATGTYSSAGALAELFDLACLPHIIFNGVTTLAYDLWKNAAADVTVADIIARLAMFNPPIVLGQHYFITNPTGSGLSPKWDFTSASEAGNPDAYVIGVRTGDIPAPTNPSTNVDWLSLRNGGGDLADQIFRVQTNGGQPPTSCTPGSADISVRYTSQYWFYGGSF